TFTEPVSGLDVSDFVVPNGSLSAPTANADRTVWTSTFTPTLNTNDATNTIELKLTGVTDDIPNPGVGSVSSANYSVDTRP
ncbi:Ig-like domain-containing protein, partial [Verminephrobacter aporrectodeae]